MINGIAGTNMLIYVGHNPVYNYDSYYQVLSLPAKTVRVKAVKYYEDDNRVEVAKNAGNVLHSTFRRNVSFTPHSATDVKVVSYNSLVH